jgi:hypothetical protein
MATNFNSVSDDDLTTLLQALFHETVRLQIMLEDTEAESARLKEERRKLASRIKKSHEEISRIVKEMKRRAPDTKGVKKTTTKTPSIPIQSDLMHQTISAAAR